MSRVLMFSSDCHAGLKTTDYVDYLESEYHEDLERFLVADAEWRETLRSQRPDAPSTRAFAEDAESRQIYATQLDKRLPALDDDGFVGEVLFPDASSNNRMPFSAATMGGVSGDYPPEHHAAAMRAYNRWLVESVDPQRQLPLAQIPLLDPEYACQQVKGMRAAGFRGIVPQWAGIDTTFPDLFAESLDPLWATCAADGLVVNFHTGSGIPTVIKRQTRSESMIYAFEKVFWTRRALWHMILGGVLERHPDLKVGIVETFADWVPRTIGFMEWMWEQQRGDLVCPLRPSEYVARQCFISAHAMSLEEQRMHPEFPPGTLAFATDFPHTGSPWGVTVKFLQATMGVAQVPEDEARAILGGNIARIYDLDTDELAALVERVGPKPEEILSVPKDVDLTEDMLPYIKAKAHRPATI